MRAFIPFATLALGTIGLAACGSTADNNTTQTQMDDVDSVAGTISDDMLNTDESVDEAPVDATPLPGDAKPKDKSDSKAADASKSEPIVEKTPDAKVPKVEPEPQ